MAGVATAIVGGKAVENAPPLIDSVVDAYKTFSLMDVLRREKELKCRADSLAIKVSTASAVKDAVKCVPELATSIYACINDALVGRIERRFLPRKFDLELEMLGVQSASARMSLIRDFMILYEDVEQFAIRNPKAPRIAIAGILPATPPQAKKRGKKAKKQKKKDAPLHEIVEKLITIGVTCCCACLMCIPCCICCCSAATVELFEPLLPSAMDVEAEVDRWKHRWSQKESPPLNQLAEDAALSRRYPNISALLKILVTLPVSTATPERTFSTLGRLFTDERATMLPSRLSNLAILASYKAELDALNLDKVIDRYAQKSERRLDFT